MTFQETAEVAQQVANPIALQGAASMLAVRLIEVMKNREWLGLKTYTDRLNVAASAFAAVATNLGVTFTAATLPDGSTAYTFGGLPAPSDYYGWLVLLSKMYFSFGFQRWYYHSAWKPNKPTE